MLGNHIESKSSHKNYILLNKLNFFSQKKVAYNLMSAITKISKKEADNIFEHSE